jgi:hypothetical protein
MSYPYPQDRHLDRKEKGEQQNVGSSWSQRRQPDWERSARVGNVPRQMNMTPAWGVGRPSAASSEPVTVA